MFYKKPSFWIKIVLLIGVVTAPFISDDIRKLIVMFIIGV